MTARAALQAALLWLLATLPTYAQTGAATLIADRVTIDGGSRVVAEGNVEVLYEGRRVIADRVIYDQASDEVIFDGEVTVIDTQSNAILTGQSAALSRDFERGVIRGARFVLDGQLQVAAAEMNRVDGRYTQLYKTVASSCRVCEGKAPLWQIRAKRVIHDQEERQLYFDQASFELGGVPVAYFPRLRMPDSTQTRASGLLVPQIRNSSTLGVGLKFPYFITLGDHADVLLTPFISTNTRTVEARFRQAFSFGTLQLDGAASVDELTTDDLRTYLFATGRFDLPQDFKFNIDVRLVSDNGYLLAYDYSDLDRLPSTAEITRTRRDEHISFSAENIRSLRAAEVPIEDTIATLLGRFTYERRLQPNLIGGQARLVFDLEGHERNADSIDASLAAACTTAGVSAADCLARDAARMGLLAEWRRGWTMGNGLQAAFDSSVATDLYWINQDSNFDSFLSHVTPTAAVELRWPLARTTRSGAREILEPLMQVAWTENIGANIPNEDSKIVEFDEGNLLALSRFPGSDVYERGWRATVGANWTRYNPNGLQFTGTVGKVFRLDDLGQFTSSSGLDGGTSDWLVAAQVKTGQMTLTNRSLFDDSFVFAKSETHVAWRSEKVSATGSYVWVVDDPSIGTTGNTSEFNFDADYRFADNWTANVNGRYDENAQETTEAGFGLKYTNECVNVDFSVSRRFTTSTNLEASTDYGLSVSLNGFGQDGRQRTRGCHG